MAIRVNCPACKALLSVDDQYRGRKIKCSKCQTICVAEESPPVSPPAPTEPEPILLERATLPPPPLLGTPSGIQAEKPIPAVAPSVVTASAEDADVRRRPRPKPAASNSPFLLIAILGGVGVAAVLGLACLGVVGWTMFNVRAPAKADVPHVHMHVDMEKHRFDDEKRFFDEKKMFEEEKKFFEEKNPIVNDPPFNPPPIDPPFNKPIDPLPSPITAAPIVAQFPPVDASKLVLKPAPLEADTVTRQLPATIDDLVVGGGGRFLLFSLPQLNKVGMFDVNEGKVVHYFPAAESDVKIAAGLTKLVMAYPTTKVIQRWDLLTKEKELTTALPDIGSPKMVLMGSASHGPVLVAAGGDGPFGGKTTFLNLGTFKEIHLDKQAAGWREFHAGYTRVSADGTVFGTWSPHTSPQGLNSYVLTGNQLKHYNQHKSMGHIVPGPDGKVLYTASGMFTNQCQAIGGAEENRMNYVLPAVQGQFYLTVKIPDRFGDNKSRTTDLSIHMGGDTRPLVQINDILRFGDGPIDGINRWDREKFGADKRILFIPDADLLVLVPPSNDRLELRRVNVEQTLENSGVDFLYVLSRAPEAVQRGTTLSYSLNVKTKKGGLKYKLDDGPKGMKVSTTGVVVWAVDADHPLNEESVLLTISDSAGQEVFHSFKVRVVADALPVPQAKEPPKDLKFEEPKKNPIGKGFDPPKGGPQGFGAIKPVKLEGERVDRMLPGSLSDICVGGGGRYLCAMIPSQRKVALFDANEGKFVHYFPLAGDSARIAAGREHLLIAYPDTNILQRWSLATKEKDLTVNSPFQQAVESVTMGSDSDGPILVAFKSDQRGIGAGFGFVDLKFKIIDVAFGKGNFERPGGQPVFIHASSDGTLFGARDGVGGEPHRVNMLKVAGNTGKAEIAWISTSTLVPSPDARFVYSGSGVYTPELKLIFPQKEQTSFAKPYLPALHGPYFMRLDYTNWDKPGGSVAFFFQGNFSPFATIANVEGVSNEQVAYGSNRDSLPYSKRVFLIPGANLLVSVPKTNDRFTLHQVDMNKLLENSPIDYLLVASSPPVQMRRGERLQYKIDVRSKKGGLRFNLDAGPRGMAVSPQGDLTWAVPDDFPPGDENIIVTIRDAAGQEIFHTFRLRVRAAAD